MIVCYWWMKYCRFWLVLVIKHLTQYTICSNHCHNDRDKKKSVAHYFTVCCGSLRNNLVYYAASDEMSDDYDTGGGGKAARG